MTQDILVIIAWAGFLVGSLDLAAATLNFLLSGGQKPVQLLYFIASGLIGKKAFAGGRSTAILGALLHYGIAYTWTTLFFFLYARVPFFAQNTILSGIGYGCCIWLVMTVVVLPLSQTPKRPFNLTQVFINAVILVLCIGIPLALIASKQV